MKKKNNKITIIHEQFFKCKRKGCPYKEQCGNDMENKKEKK